MKLPEDEIKERFYKGEITFAEAKKQLESLIFGMRKCRKTNESVGGKNA